MPKLTIELDSKTHKILKESARKDERSLTQYIQRTLRQCAGTLDVTMNDTISNVTTTPQPNQHNNTTTSIENKRKKSVIGLTMDTNTEGADNLWN